MKIRRRNRPVEPADLARIHVAIRLARTAKHCADLAESHHAAAALQRALKSLDVALRHARGCLDRPRPARSAKLP